MNMMATSRIEPGWPLTSVCPSEVRAKRPGSGSVNTPAPASVRSSRCSDGGCALARLARTSAGAGPAMS